MHIISTFSPKKNPLTELVTGVLTFMIDDVIEVHRLHSYRRNVSRKDIDNIDENLNIAEAAGLYDCYLARSQGYFKTTLLFENGEDARVFNMFGSKAFVGRVIGEKPCEQVSGKFTGCYVLVKYPESSSCFEENVHCYPCNISDDKEAKYVKIEDYIQFFGYEPYLDKCYQVMPQLEYSKLIEQNELKALCESISDKQGTDDFGSNACWIPLTVCQKLQKHNENESED